ncbi:MAG: hypothetical protein KKD17_00430 [Nanoarchaeota archaeon]|nr:hypothetical protein [Nanoarchaeota archaeon]
MGKKGKKEQIEHINYALVAKPHTPMYLIHKYWARKPHNVVSEYIKHYTKPGDIVLDPFCGSGPTPIEAIKIGRKAVGLDLNPVSVFITRMTAMPVDVAKIRSTFQEIEKSCRKDVEDLYRTTCPKCKKDALIVYVIKENEKMIEIGYECEKCLSSKKSAKRFLVKKPDDADFKLLEKIEKAKIPFWYPTQRLAYNGDEFKEGTHDSAVDSVDKLFDKRALMALSILHNSIMQIKDEKIKDVFKIIFTSNVHNVSKLNPVHQPRWKVGMHPSTSWILHRFWLPTLRVECPVWFYFKERYKHIIEAKKDSTSQIKEYKEAKKFSDLNDGANILLKEQDAVELTKVVPPNSVDYIFTDPPYGGAVQYFELSTLWAAWLKIDLDYKDEITVNKQQKKDFESYHRLLRTAFKEMYLALKPGKYMTVTFHSTDIKVWNSIVKAVAMVGFDLDKIIYQPPARPSAKGLLQPYGSAVGDYYIRFRKPETETLKTEKEIDMKTYEMEVVESAKIIIGERAEPTMFQHILNGIMVELKGGRHVPVGAKNIEQVLKDHVGTDFELIDIYDDKGKKTGKKWWLKGMDLTHFTQPMLSDRVERTVLSILDKRPKVSFDDILQEIFITFPNALTPETEKIKDILSQYAEQRKGSWVLRPEVKVSLSHHNKMISLIANLGRNLKFDVWVGLKEQAETYNKQKLSELVTIKEPSWRFVNPHNWDRINMIDVIWHDGGRIKFIFEVENTTAITDAISRGSNIPPNHLTRVIVIPKEREKMLSRKMRDPMVAEGVKKYDWKFTFYDDIEKVCGKKKVDISEIEKTFRVPKETHQVQDSLSKYV